MRFVQCDGCGKKIETTGDVGFMTIHVRISGRDAETHACSNGCAEQATKAAASRALGLLLHPKE